MAVELVHEDKAQELAQRGHKRRQVLLGSGVIAIAAGLNRAPGEVSVSVVSWTVAALLFVLSLSHLGVRCWQLLQRLHPYRRQPALLWLTSFLWWLRPDIGTLLAHRECLDMLGRRKAVELGELLLEMWTRETFPLAFSNSVVNTFISFGHYREALALAPAPDADDPEDEAKLIEVNLVEAEYNLGLLADARRRLDRIKQRPAKQAWLDAGIRNQDAWLLALEGRTEAALELALAVAPELLPESFRAEVHFTRAFAALELGRFEQARAELEQGRKRAIRPSSIRNHRFLMGICEQKAGAPESALRHFAAGVAAPYDGQGGDALLAYGQTLAALERPDDACAIYRLLLERDPESRACAPARERLRALEERPQLD